MKKIRLPNCQKEKGTTHHVTFFPQKNAGKQHMFAMTLLDLSSPHVTSERRAMCWQHWHSQ
jgi:hypothetical protein